MYQLILIIHVFVAVCLIALVLVQQGKGATMGAAFGSGASQTMFGSRGSGSFLLKITISFIVIFFLTSIGLNYLATRMAKEQQQMQFVLPEVPQPASKSAPASDNSLPASIPMMPNDNAAQLPVGKKK